MTGSWQERREPNLRRAMSSRAQSGASARDGRRVFLDARGAIGANFESRFPIYRGGVP